VRYVYPFDPIAMLNHRKRNPIQWNLYGQIVEVAILLKSKLSVIDLKSQSAVLLDRIGCIGGLLVDTVRKSLILAASASSAAMMRWYEIGDFSEFC
jgi:hypothetical protein